MPEFTTVSQVATYTQQRIGAVTDAKEAAEAKMAQGAALMAEGQQELEVAEGKLTELNGVLNKVIE